MKSLALLLLLAPSTEDVVWMKLEQARVFAARAGKPILIIVTVDPKTGSSVCGKSSGLDKALSDPAIEKRAGNFCFVRACDRKTAEAVRATRCLELIFLEPDGEEVYRAEFKDAPALDKAMASAAERCAPRAVAWAAGEGAAGKPVVYVFGDAELHKALEDRAISPLHDRLVFVKASVKSEDAKRFGVTQAPALVVVDKGEVLEKLAGRKPAKDLRAALLRALGKAQK
ncbi:MAG TPA: hypothetical protein VF950_18095 [Planctomycetota bacterium]